MTKTVRSCSGVLIRLTDERWSHIVEEHCELAGHRDDILEAIADPQRVFAGTEGELLAVRPLDNRQALVVVYRETSDDDGFVITAFITTRISALDRRRQVWPRQT